VHLSTLSAWLDWIGSVHNKEIDLGLDRIHKVASRLGVLKPSCKLVTVGGTNGKGSVVAGLEAIYLAAGYRTGAFTSPFLFVHNEEVRVNGNMADDTAFCDAFEKIEAVRGDVSLSPFEYHTLAALLIFQEANLDLMILEVGLGGRLDAVNIMDADVAIVTSIGIDHVEWLGHTREAIAVEKAGIFRAHKPAICGDDHPPASLAQAAAQVGAKFYQQGKDFHFAEANDNWSWRSAGYEYVQLPRNNLLTRNMSTVLMAVTQLQESLPVNEDAIRHGLQNAALTGRIQIVAGPVIQIFDVAHNPAAAQVLAERLHHMPCAGKTVAVFSMLGDKDIAGTVAAVADEIDEWYIAPLTCKRAASVGQLKEHTVSLGLKIYFDSVRDAYQAAMGDAKAGDRVVIFGSFYIVAAVVPSSQCTN
jgi:dihydrofolate synthase/folylpolyglutamate synthase